MMYTENQRTFNAEYDCRKQNHTELLREVVCEGAILHGDDGSIAGFIRSPLCSVYVASKAALMRFIESANMELEMMGNENCILNQYYGGGGRGNTNVVNDKNTPPSPLPGDKDEGGVRGKYAIVTGSVKGIGEAIGLRLLQGGYTVIFNYASDDAAAKKLREKAALLSPGRYFIIKKPLETKESVEGFVASCLNISAVFDVIVCNAGCTDRNAWASLDWDAWQHVMDVNLNAPAHMLRLLDRHINEGGSVIFIGSDMGIYPHAMSVPYSVSKAAVHSLTESLVKIYASRSIRVNAIAPGFVDTSWQKDKPQQIRKNIEGKVALHRFADPEEIAQMAVSVIENGYVNGSVIQVDGGYCYQ